MSRSAAVHPGALTTRLCAGGLAWRTASYTRHATKGGRQGSANAPRLGRPTSEVGGLARGDARVDLQDIFPGCTRRRSGHATGSSEATGLAPMRRTPKRDPGCWRRPAYESTSSPSVGGPRRARLAAYPRRSREVATSAVPPSAPRGPAKTDEVGRGVVRAEGAPSAPSFSNSSRRGAYPRRSAAQGPGGARPEHGGSLAPTQQGGYATSEELGSANTDQRGAGRRAATGRGPL